MRVEGKVNGAPGQK